MGTKLSTLLLPTSMALLSQDGRDKYPGFNFASYADAISAKLRRLLANDPLWEAEAVMRTDFTEFATRINTIVDREIPKDTGGPYRRFIVERWRDAITSLLWNEACALTGHH